MAAVVTPILPNRKIGLLDPDGTASLPWYRWFQDIITQAGSVDPAIIAAIEAAIAALEAEVAALQAALATAKTIRFYGSLSGMPTDGQALFEAGLEMDGDEVFESGLPNNLFSLTTAPTANTVWPIKVNGTQIGLVQVMAGSTTGIWSMAGQYNAAQGDILNFYAPSPQDATAAGPRYTFIGTRS